ALRFSWGVGCGGQGHAFAPVETAIPSLRPSRAGERRPSRRAPDRRAWSTTLPGWWNHFSLPSSRSVVEGTAEQFHYNFIRGMGGRQKLIHFAQGASSC